MSTPLVSNVFAHSRYILTRPDPSSQLSRFTILQSIMPTIPSTFIRQQLPTSQKNFVSFRAFHPSPFHFNPKISSQSLIVKSSWSLSFILSSLAVA